MTMGLVGLHALRPVTPHLSIGPSVFGATEGDHGGYFGWGVGAAYRWRQGDWSAEVGLFVGGGGGSPGWVGGGLMLRPSLLISRDVGPLRLGLGVSQVTFPSGTVRATVPFASLSWTGGRDVRSGGRRPGAGLRRLVRPRLADGDRRNDRAVQPAQGFSAPRRHRGPHPAARGWRGLQARSGRRTERRRGRRAAVLGAQHRWVDHGRIRRLRRVPGRAGPALCAALLHAAGAAGRSGAGLGWGRHRAGHGGRTAGQGGRGLDVADGSPLGRDRAGRHDRKPWPLQRP